eukprot:1145526-Pelagomonas_calceolata.AAC.6
MKVGNGRGFSLGECAELWLLEMHLGAKSEEQTQKESLCTELISTATSTARDGNVRHCPQEVAVLSGSAVHQPT